MIEMNVQGIQGATAGTFRGISLENTGNSLSKLLVDASIYSTRNLYQRQLY